MIKSFKNPGGRNNLTIAYTGSKFTFFKFFHRLALTNLSFVFSYFTLIFTLQPLRPVGVLFSPMVSGWSDDGEKFVRAVSQKPLGVGS